MRLTLRTLLAYMDDTLQPADREELAKKIEGSEFANDLIHRTKDTMRRLRLSAPQVVGAGMGLDPNTVAEYLDNSLSPESVADFERICLESDVHLAEAASCLHILKMVLGEPADVDPVAKQRMYSIPAEAERRRQVRIEPAHVAPVARAPVPAPPVARPIPPRVAAPMTSAPPREPARHAAPVPDYLRASAWNRFRLPLVALAATLLIAITALLIYGLKGWSSDKNQLAMNAAPPATAPPLSTEPSTQPALPPAASEPAAPPQTSSAPTAVNTNTAAIDQAPPPLMLPASAEPSPPPVEAQPDPYSVAQSSASNLTPPNVGTDAGNILSTPPPTSPVNDQPSMTATPDAAMVEGGLASNGPVEASPPLPPAGAMTASAPVPPQAAPEVATELGTYLDGKTVLLHFDPVAAGWFRLAPRSQILAGDKLLALPVFYPKLSLASGLHMKLGGGTQISLIAAPANAIGDANAKSLVPTIHVAYGRLVATNTASGDNEIHLSMSSLTPTIRFAPGATLAVEVVPRYLPGRDPRESPSPVIVHLYVRTGSIEWQDEAGSRTVASPTQWSINDGIASAVSTDANFPNWIDDEPVDRTTDLKLGAPAVEVALQPSRPAEAQLLELYQTNRKNEVKSLVARSSVYVGQFVPFIEALRDSDQKATWKTHIETLRSAMALGPESAEQVWQALVDQRGEAAAGDLYEMICGYAPEEAGRTQAEVDAGPIPRLIGWLENDNLDYRVLASQNLQELTGKRLMQNPAGSPTERAKGVRIWRERLKSGDLVAGAK